MSKAINIFCNNYDESKKVKEQVISSLEANDIKVFESFKNHASYNLVIGGDGTFINACHESKFSSIPFIGINTGHLGFYQEIPPEKFEYAIDAIVNDAHKVQQLKLINCYIQTNSGEHSFFALNEIVLKAKNANIVHFNMFVNDVLLQEFSGDGIILSTPSGSTAYNLSAGGAILYQTLDGFQITPIAPLRSSIFKSLDKSLIVPADTKVRILVKKPDNSHIILSIDGIMQSIKDIKYIEITMSNRVINKVIIDENWYWQNIKEKLI